jgi:hypothetical protein
MKNASGSMQTSGDNLVVLRQFVREQLGCGCPETVLQNIRLSPRADATCGFELTGELDVGGRLLVIACHLVDEDSGSVAGLIERAVGERDRRGFNRVRLVVTTQNPIALQPRIARPFETATQGDDRVHLHVLETGAVPSPLSPGKDHPRPNRSEEST